MKIPSPPVNPESKAFFDAAREGKLLLAKCSCLQGAALLPARGLPVLRQREDRMGGSEGQGTIYSYSVMRRVAEPYAIAYVTLDEGVTMLTNIVDCDLDRLRIGDAVRLVFKAAEGGEMIPMFTK